MDNFDARDEKAEHLKNILTMMIVPIVDFPDDVKLSYRHGEQTTVIEVRVNPIDLGKVIGKQGRNVTALRVLLTCISTKNKIRAVMEVIEK